MMADNEVKSRGRAKASSKTHKNIDLQSPYSRHPLKTRSVSNSKNSINKQGSTLTSSTKALFSDLFSCNIEKKNSEKNSIADFRKDIDDLNSRFYKELNICRNTEEELEVYQKYFTEIIKSNKKHGKILQKIKAFYENCLFSKDQQLIYKLKSELKELQSQATKDYRDKQLYVKKLEKLSKENVELGRSLDESEEKYQILLQKLKEITDYDLAFPRDEKTWKALVLENEQLSKINKEMHNDLKTISSKEKKLIGLLLDLKRLGYPVEEVYEQKHGKMKQEESFSYVDDTDNEELITGRAKDVAKPSCVPLLKLKNMPDAEISFSSDY